MIHDPHFDGDQVLLWSGDPDAPARVLSATAVREADPDAAPPEVRTLVGEVLFVPATHRSELLRFCAANGIPLRSRPDVWADLLEPFLDTSFTPREQEATLRRLAQAGLDADETVRIRERVGPLMAAYNSLHRDWIHLGLADLLDAAFGTLVPRELRIPPPERDAFLAWATGIANRADGQRPSVPLSGA
ncbi:hypothetical protein [Streptomyces sp. NPDC090112]|uniref:hypothetical protein n=1 Tax=Streptomyces sp. NPDC090112 TaxID=3365949 RepID=UPI00380B0D1E